MKERLLDLDQDRRDRGPALHRQLLQQRGLAGHGRPAVDPHRLVEAGHHEQQRHLRVGGDVGQRIDAAVAGPVGDRQPPVGQDLDEAGRVAARRDVLVALRIGGAQHQEGRAGDEVAAVPVQPRQHLVARQRVRLAVECPQVLDIQSPRPRS